MILVHQLYASKCIRVVDEIGFGWGGSTISILLSN